MNVMNVTRPIVSAKVELAHRVRHMSLECQAELEALAKDPAADLSRLTEQERGIIECMRESATER